jgi:hypothetical protein
MEIGKEDEKTIGYEDVYCMMNLGLGPMVESILINILNVNFSLNPQWWKLF